MDNKKNFTEKELDNYAKIMLWGLKKARKQELCKGSFIEVKYEKPGLYLAEKIYENLIKQGFNPIIKQLKTSSMEKFFFLNADETQLKAKEPGYMEYFSGIAGSITIIAPSSLNHLIDADTEKISVFSKSRQDLRNILNEREKKGEYSWSLCIYPTKALADASGQTIKEYSEQISKACFLREKDPVENWQKMSDKCDNLKQRLLELNIDWFHIKSENTDLYVKNGDKRKWLGISGRNIPSFELFISPDCRYTKGSYFANQPSYRSGNIIKNIKLEFKDGKIISAQADKGEQYLQKIIETDPGAKRIGEFSMTDKKFSKINSFMANTLYDENYGGEWGNTHIAIGSSYANSFSGNMENFDSTAKKELGFNESAIHWDIVNTERKTITAFLKNGDKKIIYQNGEFTV